MSSFYRAIRNVMLTSFAIMVPKYIWYLYIPKLETITVVMEEIPWKSTYVNTHETKSYNLGIRSSKRPYVHVIWHVRRGYGNLGLGQQLSWESPMMYGRGLTIKLIGIYHHLLLWHLEGRMRATLVKSPPRMLSIPLYKSNMYDM